MESAGKWEMIIGSICSGCSKNKVYQIRDKQKLNFFLIIDLS